MQQQGHVMARQDPFGQTPFLPPPPSKSNNRGAFTQHGRYQFVDPQQQQSQSQNSNNNSALLSL